jgi:hypothetical protein
MIQPLSPIRYRCPADPLQLHAFTAVPFAVPEPFAFRHLPSARSVPSGCRVHRWISPGRAPHVVGAEACCPAPGRVP